MTVHLSDSEFGSGVLMQDDFDPLAQVTNHVTHSFSAVQFDQKLRLDEM